MLSAALRRQPRSSAPATIAEAKTMIVERAQRTRGLQQDLSDWIDYLRRELVKESGLDRYRLKLTEGVIIEKLDGIDVSRPDPETAKAVLDQLDAEIAQLEKSGLLAAVKEGIDRLNASRPADPDEAPHQLKRALQEQRAPAD
jgi:triphosphoribosyl-dephospho-CoA synthetase